MKLPSIPEQLVRDVDHAVRVINSIRNLTAAVKRAGGAESVVESHLDLPLRDFMERVAAPNGIRFHNDSNFAAGVDVRDASIREVLEALEYIKTQSSL